MVHLHTLSSKPHYPFYFFLQICLISHNKNNAFIFWLSQVECFMPWFMIKINKIRQGRSMREVTGTVAAPKFCWLYLNQTSSVLCHFWWCLRQVLVCSLVIPVHFWYRFGSWSNSNTKASKEQDSSNRGQLRPPSSVDCISTKLHLFSAIFVDVQGRC